MKKTCVFSILIKVIIFVFLSAFSANAQKKLFLEYRNLLGSKATAAIIRDTAPSEIINQASLHENILKKVMIKKR